MRNHVRIVAVLVGAMMARTARAGDIDDTVFLKDGGRMRGAVVEEDPTKGVRLRLPDGTVRQIAPRDVDHVQYGATPTQVTPPPVVPVAVTVLEGSLHVTSSVPGRVSVDGGDFGRTPVDIGHLSRGRHKVTIQFDGGGEQSRVATVRAGDQTPIEFEPSESQRLFVPRAGLHYAVGGEALLWFGLGSLDVTPGARAVGRLNYAVSPLLDLRFDATLGVAYGSGSYYTGSGSSTSVSDVFVPIVGRFDAQLNLGDVYSMSIGIDLGANLVFSTSTQTTLTPPATTSAFQAVPLFVLGLHASVLTFRFGDKRQFMVSAQEGILLFFGTDGGAAFDQTFAFGYLFL